MNPSLITVKWRERMKRVTLADIAKACNVSVNTVSHALNDKPDISEQKKEEIKKTAKEMGYIANHSASFLRTGKSKCIGIIIGDIANPFFSINIRLIERQLRKLGYTCMIFDSKENERIEKQAIVQAIGKNVDGIIISPAQQSEENINFLIEQRVPFVLMGRRFRDIDTNYVVTDEHSSGCQAAEYLINKECNKIALLMLENSTNTDERTEGVVHAFKKHGRALCEQDCFYVKRSEESHKEIMEEILKSDYDGVICFADVWALEFLTYAKREIEVVSFDSIRSNFFIPCAFASVGTSKEEFCDEIVKMLFEAMNGNKKTMHVVLKTEILE